jgi:hypothetical protein
VSGEGMNVKSFSDGVQAAETPREARKQDTTGLRPERDLVLGPIRHVPVARCLWPVSEGTLGFRFRVCRTGHRRIRRAGSGPTSLVLNRRPNTVRHTRTRDNLSLVPVVLGIPEYVLSGGPSPLSPTTDRNITYQVGRDRLFSRRSTRCQPQTTFALRDAFRISVPSITALPSSSPATGKLTNTSTGPSGGNG